MSGIPCGPNFGIPFKKPNPQICHKPKRFQAALEAQFWLENKALNIEDCVKSNPLQQRPPLQFDPDAIWYTDGSKVDKENTTLTGAGVYCPSGSVEIAVNPCGLEATITINRAELAAIAIALKAMSVTKEETIATDSQVCLHLISKYLDNPQDLQLCKHKKVLQDIIDSLLLRAQAGKLTRFIKVKSHIGIKGNEQADQLAVKAANLATCDVAYNVGREGLQGVYWPCTLTQPID